MTEMANQEHGKPGHENPGLGPKKYTLIVNAREHKWAEETISFGQVVQLAFPSGGGDATAYTVTYKHGPNQSQGTMSPGDSVTVKSGEAFNVTATTRS